LLQGFWPDQPRHWVNSIFLWGHPSSCLLSFFFKPDPWFRPGPESICQVRPCFKIMMKINLKSRKYWGIKIGKKSQNEFNQKCFLKNQLFHCWGFTQVLKIWDDCGINNYWMEQDKDHIKAKCTMISFWNPKFSHQTKACVHEYFSIYCD